MAGRGTESHGKSVVTDTIHTAEELAIRQSLQSIQEQPGLEDKHMPLVARIYGVLALIGGIASLPQIIMDAIYGIRQVVSGHGDIDALGLTFILSGLHEVVLIVGLTGLIALGVLLLSRHRRHAASLSYFLMPFSIVDGMLSLALQGLGLNLFPPLLQLAILTALSISLDPALVEERRLHRYLRRMDERDYYEQALAEQMVGRDMTGKGYIALDFFNIFWLFVIACVVGLGIETIYHLVIFGQLQDRAGLLWGPFSPIYGCGAVLLTICLNRLWRSNPVLIFCASAVIGGSFEYFTSWFMEVAFGITAWNYSGRWLSIDGRTSGLYMFFWGLLGVLWTKVLLPRLLWLINLIPWKVRYLLTAIFLILLLADIVMTLMALDCWYGRMSGSSQDSPITRFFGTYYNNDYMQSRFQTMSIDPSRSSRM